MTDTPGLPLWEHIEPIFGSISESARADVLSAFAPTALSEGEIWVGEGEPSATLGIVIRGRLGVSIATPSGPYEVKQLGPGDVVGEVALFDPGAASATVFALEASEVADLRFADLERLRGRHPRIAAHATRELCRRMSQRLRAVNDAAWRDAEAGTAPDDEGTLWRILTRWFGGNHG